MPFFSQSPNLVAGIFLQVTPTIQAAAYSAGNCVGAKFSLAACMKPNGAAILSDLCVIDKGNQKAALSFLFFNAALAGTYTDKSTPAFATDIGKLMARVDVATADYATFGSDTIGIAEEKNLNIVLPNNDTPGLYLIYGVCITTGTPTYASTSDLTFTFKFGQVF